MMGFKALQMMIVMLLLISLSSLSFADETDEPGALSEFLTDTTDELRSEGDAFIDAAWAGGSAVGMAPGSIFQSFSPGSCGTADSWNPSRPDIIVEHWLIPAALVGLLVLFGITLIYMAGQLLNMPQLIALAKDEGFQFIMTVIRVIYIVGIIWASSMWFGFAAPADDPVYGRPGVVSFVDASGAISRYMVVEMINSYSMLLMYN
ncbi:TPA: hypothetical protein EYP38_04365, partial [Candidatus Micrarchaeota archaeon]|nr:hypothetical protein [Candidatus Micrarchaeota archaeon]